MVRLENRGINFARRPDASIEFILSEVERTQHENEGRILLHWWNAEYAEVCDCWADARIEDSDSYFLCCYSAEAAYSFVADGLAFGDLLPFDVFLHIDGKFCYSLAEAADLLLEHYDVEGFLAGKRDCQLGLGRPVGRHPAGISVAVEDISRFEAFAASGRGGRFGVGGKIGLERLTKILADLGQHLAVSLGEKSVAVGRDIQ